MDRVELAQSLFLSRALTLQLGCINNLKAIAAEDDQNRRPLRAFPSRVMVVDDDPFVREIVETSLTAVGQVVVRTFGGGEDAVEAASDFSPDLVLLDLHLPGMDGHQTWQALCQALKPQPPVIFLTAQDDLGVKDVLGPFKPLGVISKPFDPLTFVDQIQNLVEGGVRSPLKDRIRLEGVKEKFRRNLSVTVRELEILIANLAEGERGRDAGQALLEKAHMLAGTAGIFQFDGVGVAADKVEYLAIKYLKAEHVDANATLVDLIEATKKLERECRSGCE